MHRTDSEGFAALLEKAADDIARQPIHPGQTVPGLWKIGGENPPERLIGVIATGALARVARQNDYDLDEVLASYVEVSKNISITPKGAPDTMARTHLLDAAAELRRVGQARLVMAV